MTKQDETIRDLHNPHPRGLVLITGTVPGKAIVAALASLQLLPRQSSHADPQDRSRPRRFERWSKSGVAQ